MRPQVGTRRILGIFFIHKMYAGMHVALEDNERTVVSSMENGQQRYDHQVSANFVNVVDLTAGRQVTRYFYCLKGQKKDFLKWR